MGIIRFWYPRREVKAKKKERINGKTFKKQEASIQTVMIVTLNK
jgi:hypothetical protein